MKYLALILILAFTTQIEAQHYKNPQSYFKKFQNENRKIRIKNLRYLKSSLKGDDQRKVDKYRDMVIEQLKESRKEIDRIGVYKDYDILMKEYGHGLDQYIYAFENNFGIADSLSDSAYNSYEHLRRYYDAVSKAEEEMLDAGYRIEAAEDHFAKQHMLSLVKNEELEEQYRMLDEVTLYSRDMTLSFFRVEAQVKNYLSAISKGNRDTLSEVLAEMRRSIKKSKEEVELYSDFEGNRSFYRELEDYLEEMTDEVEQDLMEITERMENQYLEESEYEDVQRDLKKFVKRHNYRIESFYDAKKDLLEDYLPED